MKNLTIALALLSLLLGMPAMAGGGHEHGHGHSHAPATISEALAEKRATQVIASLIERNKIDKIWASTAVSFAEKKILNGQQEWMVTFNNKTITDSEKQKLYVFLTLDGQYIAANYTGK